MCLWIQHTISCKQDRFPHSEISGSSFVCQLPEAYRRLLRPSSPLTAKASTICAYSLDHTTLKNSSCTMATLNADYHCNNTIYPILTSKPSLHSVYSAFT